MTDATDSAPRPRECADLIPVAGHERVVLIDALRGFALCGVLLANLPWWTGDVFMTPARQAAYSTASLDDTVRLVLRVFVDNKFIGMFSLLFGLGFTLQLQRAQACGVSPVPMCARRMVVLLALGILHGFGLWCGDILRFYALWGAMLVFLRGWSSRRLIVTGLLLGVAAPGLWRGVVMMLADPALPPSVSPLDARTLQAFADGGYLEMLRWNWAYDWSLTLSANQVAFQLSLFSRFLFGMWLGRTLWLRDPLSHRRQLRRITGWGLVIGLAGNGLFGLLTVLEDQHVISAADVWMSAMPLLVECGFLAGTAFYVAALSLLYARPAWQRGLALLAPMGRMALTNYIGHTLIGLWLFYGFMPGPRLMTDVGLSWIVPIWAAVVIVQMVLSHWWLARFRFGPLEWLWRTLSYGMQPLHRGAA